MPEDNGNGFPTFHTDTATTLLVARQNTQAAMILYLDRPRGWGGQFASLGSPHRFPPRVPTEHIPRSSS
jgi:hypothetical protein